jgi:hypothetical protein
MSTDVGFTAILLILWFLIGYWAAGYLFADLRGLWKNTRFSYQETGMDRFVAIALGLFGGPLTLLLGLRVSMKGGHGWERPF